MMTTNPTMYTTEFMDRLPRNVARRATPECGGLNVRG